MLDDWNKWITRQLFTLKSNGLQRNLIQTSQATQPILVRHQAKLINFSSNNYLGLANHPKIIQAMKDGMNEGASQASSRSLVGTSKAMKQLETELAKYHNHEAALLFSNGYMANVGVLSSFLSHHDVVLSDRLNHASIVDGIRLSQAQHIRYRHNDIDHLQEQLQKIDCGKKRIWVVTDTVFSMDGDIAKLQELVLLKQRYGFALMVDEAHGGGVFGSQGQGVVEQEGLSPHVDIHIGTLSKGFGVYGAYVIAQSNWIDFLINRCRSFIYTTSLPPVVISGIKASLQLVKQGDHLRKDLRKKSVYFRNHLRDFGFHTFDSKSQIIPILIGDETKTVLFSHKLEQRGILSLPIRPPSVPVNTSRLRFSILASHQWNHLDQALETIQQIGKEMGVI
ncbi:8-amino-7-oxononanoate synthase [Shimazuella kribbensis]|uniref:8-amino-7-oxononanoate synthase n=1 Tax=Shimazuella kribbensis TaxID=139808 RepID=UPI00041804F4|nr:8-amino-7-oxononanoate synthase [Shimazuella kribbensis]